MNQDLVNAYLRDPKGFQEQMIRFSQAGFVDLYNSYEKAMAFAQKSVQEEVKEEVLEKEALPEENVIPAIKYKGKGKKK
jgi:hypothetical protein